MHICFLLANSSGKKTASFSRYNHPYILCMSSKSLQSDDRLLCDIEVSCKTQSYCLKSVCNFPVSRSSVILLCKQHNWTLGTYCIQLRFNRLSNSVAVVFEIILVDREINGENDLENIMS